jgi:hypothetical protein
VRISAFAITQLHFIERNCGYVLRIIESERQFNIMQMPSVNELDGAINQLEIVCVGGFASPSIWSLKIKPGRDPPQKRFHSLLIPFHNYPKARSENQYSRLGARAGFAAKMRPKTDLLWSKLRGFHASCVKMTHG